LNYVQYFQTISNTFFQGGEKFSRGASPPLFTGLRLLVSRSTRNSDDLSVIEPAEFCIGTIGNLSSDCFFQEATTIQNGLDNKILFYQNGCTTYLHCSFQHSFHLFARNFELAPRALSTTKRYGVRSCLPTLVLKDLVITKTTVWPRASCCYGEGKTSDRFLVTLSFTASFRFIW